MRSGFVEAISPVHGNFPCTIRPYGRTPCPQEPIQRATRTLVQLPTQASPSKPVPAAPIIQIPMPPSTAQAAAAGVEPSPGLPYENAAFSESSASDGDGHSSGSESAYGQRVLTISELHNVLEENPHLAQRLSLDRERDRWEEQAQEHLGGHRHRSSGSGSGSGTGGQSREAAMFRTSGAVQIPVVVPTAGDESRLVSPEVDRTAPLTHP